MILLRRLNNAVIGLNADLIERIDATPDTVITLVDGKKYVVAESPEEVVERIVAFRANVLLNVGPQGSFGTPDVARFDGGTPQLRLVATSGAEAAASAAPASAAATATATESDAPHSLASDAGLNAGTES